MLKILSTIQRKRKERALVAQSFDADFYKAAYPDAVADGRDAFDHFMKEGWKLGFDPAPWFSVRDYLEKYPDIARAGHNPFQHFLVYGEQEKRTLPRRSAGDVTGARSDKLEMDIRRIAAAGYFDAGYYKKTNPDIADQGGDYLVHFCQVGWHEGRSPSKIFDLDYFTARFPRARDTRINPVIDFLDSGLADSFIPNRFGLRPSAKPVAPSEEDWAGVRSGINDTDEALDIIVPVYRGHDETLRCLFSVLSARTDTPFNLIVIDDRSPEADLSAALGRLAERGLFTLLANEENRGFVATVNRGMRLHTARDVVLLNADTEVYDHWLDHLVAHARADLSVATVTPLSNNATICSYPVTLSNNSYELEIPGSGIDQLAYETNRHLAVDVPTGVGFCFYIRRAALDAVGYFDEAAFAKGYGEENDFCVRAKDAGWRNLLALDTYVRHHGEVSFAADAAELQAKGLDALNAKHPSYMSAVNRFIKQDPAREARARLDAARIKRAKGEIALFVSHDWGGGIERNIRDLAARLEAEGMGVVVLRSDGHRTELVGIDPGPGFLVPNLEDLHVHADAGLLADLVAILAPRLIHVHSLIGFEPRAREATMAFIRGLGIPYYFTVHDYAPICAHGQFVTPAGDYCGNPGAEGCRACLNQFPPVNGWVEVEQYQDANRRFILGAEAAFAPSKDAAVRANSFLGAAKCKVSPHPEQLTVVEEATGSRGRMPKAEKSGTRVAFVGAIGLHKGRAVMESCARDSAGRDLPLFFRLMGYADSGLVGMPKLTITGKYDSDAECLQLLAKYQPHFLAFFSIWPETYSYTLSMAFLANIPPVVFDLGAMAERVKETGFGHCLPTDWTDDPRRINDFLLANPIAPLPADKHRALVETMLGQAPKTLLSPDFYSRRT